MVTRLHVKRRCRGVPRVHVKRICAVCCPWRRVHAHLPIGSTVSTSCPAVVCLRCGNVRFKRVRLEHIQARVRKHEGLPLTLVDLEIGVQETAHIQVGHQLPFSRTNHNEMSSCGHRRACRDLKFVQVVEVVRQKVSSQIHIRPSGVVEFHKIFIVSTYAQSVVAAREFIDDHLRPEGSRRHKSQQQGPKTPHGRMQ